MSIIKSITSINSVSGSLSSKSMLTSSGGISNQSGNESACIGNGLGGGAFNSCGSGASNIINIDIDIGRRRRRCC